MLPFYYYLFIYLLQVKPYYQLFIPKKKKKKNHYHQRSIKNEIQIVILLWKNFKELKNKIFYLFYIISINYQFFFFNKKIRLT